MIAIATEVLVRSLKRRGIVVEAMKAGVYRVQVGAMTITAYEEDLEAPGLSKTKKRRQTTASAGVGSESRPVGSASEPTSIDLHGLTVDEARNRVAGYI